MSSFLPHQAELQEVVGDEEAEDAESASSPSPSPSAAAKPPPAATPESPAMQVQHTLFILWLPVKDHTDGAAE